MKYFIISSFFNAVSSSLCCILILASNFKSKSAVSFALFSCTVALWSFFYFLGMLASQPLEAIFYSRILNAIALFIPITFLYFSKNISENRSSIAKNILIFFLTLDIIILPFTQSQYFIPKMTSKLLFPFWPVPGPLFHVSTVQFFLLIPISFYLIKNKILKSSNKALKILLISLIIGFIGGGTNYFLCLNIPIPPYGNIITSSFSIVFFYLVFKYQILDIQIVLSRSFVYAILIFIITFLYFLVTYLSEIYLKEIIGYKSFIFSFMTASITALAFIPLKDKLQLIIDKYFFKKSIKEVEEENKLLRQEITQSDRLKSIAILASGMAHEIKNPLTPIKTFSEQLPHRLDDKEFLLKFSRIISKEVDRIDSLVQELLTYAKPSPPQLESSSIQHIIDNTLALLNNDLLRRNIKLETYFVSTNTLSHIDPKQIKQALLNILLNAIEAMPNGGILTVKTTISSSYAITIQDTGKGIDTEDLKHIFDPFFTKKDKGTGLGLSITHEIIKNHNGKIFAESTLGKGTIFTINLPKL